MRATHKDYSWRRDTQVKDISIMTLGIKGVTLSVNDTHN
jgi:hypothetical protein